MKNYSLSSKGNAMIIRSLQICYNKKICFRTVWSSKSKPIQWNSSVNFTNFVFKMSTDQNDDVE